MTESTQATNPQTINAARAALTEAEANLVRADEALSNAYRAFQDAEVALIAKEAPLVDGGEADEREWLQLDDVVRVAAARVRAVQRAHWRAKMARDAARSTLANLVGAS